MSAAYTDLLPRVESFWRTSIMRAESLLFIKRDAVTPARAQLMFTPVDPVELTSATGVVSYALGEDFLWQRGSRTITLTPGSRIAALTDAELYPPRGSQKFGTCRDRNADLLFAGSSEFHRTQTCATYKFNLDEWDTSLSPRATANLPRFTGKLAARQPVKIVLLGDSISTGANASGLYKEPPGNPGYGPLLADALEHKTGAPIEFHNLSVGGMGAAWGITQIDQAAALQPDLLIIAFGMNDASAKDPPATFSQYISRQITDMHRQSPHTEFLLVAGMTGNPQWTGTNEAFYPLYRDALAQLQRSSTALADVFTLWQQAVARKHYLDLTGNGLNHPNDFGHCLYTMVLLDTLLPPAK